MLPSNSEVSVLAEKSDTSAETSRILPCPSTRPGCSAPGEPNRTSFTLLSAGFYGQWGSRAVGPLGHSALKHLQCKVDVLISVRSGDGALLRGYRNEENPAFY